jgi:5-oxoprolinase (ATP-hydrolysing) subunit A
LRLVVCIPSTTLGILVTPKSAVEGEMRIDLNADVAESFGRWEVGDDVALMPYLTSANVACGFHAGDPLTIRRVVSAAAEHGVTIGAHVSYPDLVGFGRRPMDVGIDQLEADVMYQISALDGLARIAGSKVRYVKPHGAMYHRVLTDPVQASAIVRAVCAWPEPLAIVTMADSELARCATSWNLQVVREGYADRGYGADGRLVPRSLPGALITDPDAASKQAVVMARSKKVDSLSLHGDSPGAVQIAAAVRAGLKTAGIQVTSHA